MDLTLTLRRRDINRMFMALVAMAAALIGAYFLNRLIGSPIWLLERLVDINGENSLPAWFSSIQLFLIGGALLLAAWRGSEDRGPAPWLLALGGAAFVFLSADEALFIHESVTQALLKVEWMFRFKGGHGIWIPVYGTLAVLGLALTWRQIWRMWSHQRRPFLIMAAGAAGFLLGAVGLEVVAYEFLVVGSPLHLAEVAAEEFLEMTGSSVMLYGSLELLVEPAGTEAKVEAVAEDEVGARAA